MKDINLFLDSGAFSAQSQKTPVDLNEYIAFIKKNEKYLEAYANLDSIGDWKQTWKNQEIMEKKGLSPLPVYHMEDPLDCLYRCLEYDYFCLGGMAGASIPARIHFLDKCWRIICKEDGMPKCKVHGFGMSAPSLMMRYPWYSVDSSSWVQYGRFGILLVPPIKDGKVCYKRAPVKIFVTSQSPRNKEQGKHFTNVPEEFKNRIKEYLKSKNIEYGESKIFVVSTDYELRENEKFVNKEKTRVERVIVKGVSNDGVLRDIANFQYFMDISKNCKPWPWAYKPEVRRFF